MSEVEAAGRGLMVATVEVEHRSSTLQDVNKKKGFIDLLAVPWEQEAEVVWRGDVWSESFDRHAFDGIGEHAGRIQVNREHVKGDTVGKVVRLDPSHPDGLFTRVKIYPTQRGEETLILADEGGAFPSVGFRVHKFSDMKVDKRARTRRILKSYLDHLALVEDPAYVGAEVLAVRAGPSLAVADRPLPKTPALDEVLSDDVFTWAASRLSQ